MRINSLKSWIKPGELIKKLENAEEEFIAFKQQEKLFSMEGKQKLISITVVGIHGVEDAELRIRNLGSGPLELSLSGPTTSP